MHRDRTFPRIVFLGCVAGAVLCGLVAWVWQ